MTPVLCCGAECGVAGPHIASSPAGFSFDTTTVRSGARSFRFNGTGGVTLSTATLASSLRWVGRFYIYFTTLPTADLGLIGLALQGGTGPNIKFQSSDSSLYAGVDTTKGASGVAITTATWYRIDFDYNISAAGNDTSDVQVNGVACAQASAGGSTGPLTALTMGFAGVGATTDMYLDDILLSHTGADYPIGAGYVNHFVPTSDGTHNVAGAGDFQRGNTGVDILNATTTAWQLVDDVPLPSGAVAEADCIRGVAPANATTDYVECIFGPASGVSTPTAGPRCVDAVMTRHEIATTVSNSRVALNDNGTLSDIWNTSQAGVTTYSYVRKAFALAPTGGAWGVTAGAGNFNNVRFRFFSPDANPDNALDAIMLEAEFVEVVAEADTRWMNALPSYHHLSHTNVSY